MQRIGEQRSLTAVQPKLARDLLRSVARRFAAKAPGSNAVEYAGGIAGKHRLRARPFARGRSGSSSLRRTGPLTWTACWPDPVLARARALDRTARSDGTALPAANSVGDGRGSRPKIGDGPATHLGRLWPAPSPRPGGNGRAQGSRSAHAAGVWAARARSCRRRRPNPMTRPKGIAISTTTRSATVAIGWARTLRTAQ
jgi:hypothetical protein